MPFKITNNEQNGPLFDETPELGRKTESPEGRVDDGDQRPVIEQTHDEDGIPFFATSYKKELFEDTILNSMTAFAIPVVDLRDGRCLSLAQAFQETGLDRLHVTGPQDHYGTPDNWQRVVARHEVNLQPDSSPITQTVQNDISWMNEKRANFPGGSRDLPPPVGAHPLTTTAVRQRQQRLSRPMEPVTQYPAVLACDFVEEGVEAGEQVKVRLMPTTGQIEMLHGNQLFCFDAEEGRDFHFGEPEPDQSPSGPGV